MENVSTKKKVLVIHPSQWPTSDCGTVVTACIVEVLRENSWLLRPRVTR